MVDQFFPFAFGGCFCQADGVKAWRIFFILCLLLWSIAGLFAKPVHSYPPNSNSTRVSGYGPVLGYNVTDLGNRQLGFQRDQDDWAYRNSAAGQYMAAYQQTQRKMQAAWQYGIDNDNPYAAADRREGALISAVNVATLGLSNVATVLATGRDMSGDLVTSQEKWFAGVNVGLAVAPSFSMAGRSFGAMRGLEVAEGRLFSKTGGEVMDTALFRRIQTAFESKGPGRIMANNVWSERHLGPDLRITGEALNENVIALRIKPSTSSVYEELIHKAQIRRGMTDVTQMEIQAAQKLIRFADRYGITAAETAATQRRLEQLLVRQRR